MIPSYIGYQGNVKKEDCDHPSDARGPCNNLALYTTCSICHKCGSHID